VAAIDLEPYLREFSPEEINAYPLKRWRGPVRVVGAKKKAAAAARELAKEDILGFDTESRPSFSKGKCYPVSLLQLAGAGEVYLFQLGRMNVPDELRRLLSDPGLPKAGVAVRDDLKELRELMNFEPAGFVDLSSVAASHGLKTRGLRNLAANLLGFRISKGQRCTNWSRPDLSKKQITYAATDAWVGRELYLKMRELGMLDGELTENEKQ
jgi:ribonuclease D